MPMMIYERCRSMAMHRRDGAVWEKDYSLKGLREGLFWTSEQTRLTDERSRFVFAHEIGLVVPALAVPKESVACATC